MAETGELPRLPGESINDYQARIESAKRAHKEVFEEAPDELV